MIDWIKQEGGSWRFDYRIFDEYVSLAIEAGITKAITVYTPLPWANRFQYLDDAPATSSRSRGHPIPTNSRAPGTRFSMT